MMQLCCCRFQVAPGLIVAGNNSHGLVRIFLPVDRLTVKPRGLALNIGHYGIVEGMVQVDNELFVAQEFVSYSV